MIKCILLKELEAIDAALLHSMKHHGQIEPITLNRTAKGFQVLDGEKRIACARQLGWHAISAQVLELTETQVAQFLIMISVRRIETTPEEYGRNLRKLMASTGLAIEQLAIKLGKPVEKVKEWLDK